MHFPEYKLASYQMMAAPKTQYAMGASAPEAMMLQELLSLADEEEARQWHDFTLGYSTSQGDPMLREQLALTYPGLSADNFIVFAGALEAIYVAYHALLNAGDKVQVITPVFEPLAIVAGAIGAKVSPVNMQLAGENWQLDIDQWIEGLRPETQLATINFPHNPTGAMISRLQLQLMVDACRENQCWLFSDEVFRGLEYDETARLPPAASLYEKALSLGVMSKAYGLGGVRVGWIACQDKALIKRMLEIKHFLSICNGRADELLTRIALNHSDVLLERNRQLLRQNLKLLNENGHAIEEWFKWFEPLAGCVAYPEVKGEQSITGFAERLLTDTGIMVVPGNCFLQGDSYIRLGFGRKDFPQAFEKFVDYLSR